jgi:thiamine transporter
MRGWRKRSQNVRSASTFSTLRGAAEKYFRTAEITPSHLHKKYSFGLLPKFLDFCPKSKRIFLQGNACEGKNFFMKKNLTLSIALGANAIALSIALDLIPHFSMPLGGSVTFFSLLPLVVYSYIFGWQKGMFAGLAYGVLSYFMSTYGLVNPWNIILDYPLPLCLVGLSGVFSGSKGQNQMLWGTGVAAVARFIPHFISGILFYAAYAPEGMNGVLYSFLYNGLFVAADMLIVAAGVFALERNRSFMKFCADIKAKLNDDKAKNAGAEQENADTL